MNAEEVLEFFAGQLDQEAEYGEAWDGNEQETIRNIAARMRALTTVISPVVGYVIAERHVSGPDAGRLDADWDGLVHETREAAVAELVNANRCLDEDDPTQAPPDHWKLYELREVTP